MALPPYTIDDPITDPLTYCVEVTLDFGGQKRWLLFASPTVLATIGDFIDGTQARMHLGERHMIVVSELNETVIDKALCYLHDEGELVSRTLPFIVEE